MIFRKYVRNNFILLINFIALTGGVAFGQSTYPQFLQIGSEGTKYFGQQLIAISDVNGDGNNEYVVTYYRNEPANWIVDAYSGKDSSLLYRLTGASDQMFGASLTNFTDIDGDGRSDFIVGTTGRYGCSGNHSLGKIEVRSGLNGNVIYTVNGTSLGGVFGQIVKVISDINSDGYPDILVLEHGALRQSQPCGVSYGRVVVISGLTGSVIRMHNGTATDKIYDVGLIGDRDGDQIEDYRAGDKIFSGLTGQFIRNAPLSYATERVNDLTGDGDSYSDFANISLSYTLNFRKGVAADVIHCSVTNANFENLASVGDINGDGITDVATIQTSQPGRGLKVFSSSDCSLIMSLPNDYAIQSSGVNMAAGVGFFGNIISKRIVFGIPSNPYNNESYRGAVSLPFDQKYCTYYKIGKVSVCF